MLIFIIYMIAGYWGVSIVLYRNKVVFEQFPGQLMIVKFGLALVTGWLFFPIAIIMKILRIR